jgi:hypothetical protein
VIEAVAVGRGGIAVLFIRHSISISVTLWRGGVGESIEIVILARYSCRTPGR